MAEPSSVDRLRSDFQALAEALGAAEPSLQTTADDCFRKILLLSAASYFERVVMDAVLAFVSEAASRNECVIEFVRRKGLARQYHSLFDWDSNNANRFFALFGDGFKTSMTERLKADADLEDAVKAFMEIGRERNRLIHQDLAHIALEKTSTEIFALYGLALKFVSELPALLATATGQER